MTKVLMLYDEVTPTLAKEFVSQMAKLSPTEAVVVAVNSPGGHVASGDAIAASIDRHRGPTTCRIDGIAASAASFICCFSDRIVVAAAAHVMVHRPWANMVGCADDLTSAGTLLKEVERRYCQTYAIRTGLAESKVLDLMKNETWLNAKQAVELGFADEIDTTLALAKSVAKAVLQYKHVPQEVRAMAGEKSKSGLDEAEIMRQRRQRLVRRQAIRNSIAARSIAAQDHIDLERGRLASRRLDLRAVVKRVREDDARRDLEERAQAARKLEIDRYCDRLNIPRKQRVYG